MGRTDHHHVPHWGVLAQGLVAQDRALDFLGTDAVTRDINYVIRTAMQCKGAFFSAPRIVALGIGEFALPTAKIHVGKALDIALPLHLT